MYKDDSGVRRKNTIACLVVMVACCSLAHALEGDRLSKEKEEPLFCWVEMERHSEPVLQARPGTWEASWFGVGSANNVKWPDGRMRMYYRGSDKGAYNTQLGLVYSDDGVKWQRDERNPIWVDDWDHFLRDVRVYQFEGEEGYWLYYSDGDQHLDLAHSTDGIHWKNSEHNPILVPSQDWEDFVMQESVLKIDDKWYMWYSTYGKKPRVTGLATSADGIHWTKHKDNPVLVVGKPGEWDDFSAFQPMVFRQDDYFHMIYTGSIKNNGTGYAWGYAWSADGIHWTKSPQNPIFRPGPKDAWDAGKVSTHQIYQTSADTYNIYYSGAPTPKATYKGIGLVRARLQKLIPPSSSQLPGQSR